MSSENNKHMNIGKYEVEGELGHGAMGTVYRARDPRLDRMVAIKLIQRSATQDAKIVTMFEKEARAIARLSHPNIVTIFEFDYSDHQPYIVMELLKGSDLTDIDRLQNLSIPKKLDLVRQVCDGLAHAHEQGIIHRDIKPANIFLTEGGSVKLTDFGIARLSSATMTTGAIMGTPEFMAPERLATGKADARSDLFSTGVVLYWLLSGVRPFAAEDINAIFYRILNHEPVELSLTGISEAQIQEMNRIIRKSLIKNPDERYASAADMSRDLRNLEQWIHFGTQPVAETQSATVDIASGETAATDDFPKTVLKPQTPTPTQPDKTIRAGMDAPRQRTPRNPALALILLVIAAAGLFAGYRLLSGHRGDVSKETALSAGPGATPGVALAVATGKEKLQWVELYSKKFMALPEGKSVNIRVIPIGSQDAFRAVVEGDQKINVWTPASDMLEDLFVQEWTAKYHKNPILDQQNLGITPMVLVMWEPRYQEFIKKYKVVSFASIVKAMQEENGWGTIAGKPEWGPFKFGLSDPNRYNSGLVLLFILCHEYHQNPRALTAEQIQDKGIVKWMEVINSHAVGMSKESRDLLEDMIAKGPASFDAAFTYESLALRSLKNAEGRWGSLRIIYPAYNFWMDNPFYVLDAPWSSVEQKDAARSFMRYLYSQRVQKELLNERIRPANPEVPLLNPDSPFLLYKEEGVVLDIQNAIDEPKADIVKAMLKDWAQISGASQQQP